MEQRRAKGHDGQNFQREYDFLDVVRVRQDQAGCPIDYLSEKVENHEPRKQDDCELGLGLAASRPSRLEHHAKHEGVNKQHEHRVKEGPDDSEKGALVSPQDISFDQGLDKPPVVPETAC
jgi:hypothetical protein